MDPGPCSLLAVPLRWLQFTRLAQANGPLTNENVFDYFATSMFYDKQSNNQVLRMQTMHTGQPLLNEAEELRWA